MLLEFNVTNFRSLRDRQTFSMVANTGKELIETNTFKTTAHTEYHLLRSATLYGANASGKSNVLKALDAMRRIVLSSGSSNQRGDSLKVHPFRLDKNSSQAPSEFEVTFIVDEVRYQYGFSATAERIHDEWLLAYPKGRPQQWFERSWNEEKKAYDWQLGSNLTGEKHLWKKSTRDNALFLSTAVQLNSKQLQPIYDWFDTTLRISDTEGWGHGFSASLCEKDEKTQMMDYLRAADLNIEDVKIDREPFNVEALPDDMPASIKELIANDMKDKQMTNINMMHKTSEGKEVNFDFATDESEGTQRLFSFAGPWIDSLANGYVLFVDELHNSLHPNLVKFLVSLFHSDKTNPKNAQLVFTTHETSILNQEVFRRDQIWFCEKDKQQATTLYPLSDFKPRNDQNLELAYLSGRFGALPYVSSLKG